MRAQSYTASGVLADGEHLALIDATAGALTMQLPPARDGLVIVAKKIDASNTITIDAGSGTIDGSRTKTLTKRYQSLELYALSGVWYIARSFASTADVQTPASPTAITQTYATAAAAVPAATAVAPATTGATQTTPYGYAGQAQADAIPVAIVALIADVLALRKVVNQIIDDLQSAGIES